MYTVETEQELETGELNIYWFLDLLISGIFGIEFFSRIWVAGIDRRFRGLSGLFNYFKTNWFMLVVDFLAFAPELIFVIIGVNPPSWLRSLRVFRLIKMVRYIPAVELVTKASSRLHPGTTSSIVTLDHPLVSRIRRALLGGKRSTAPITSAV